ncbi:MAG: hypothetical protein V7K71_07765 [Nostoc sp.]|uniref:hypothetical protein n=1 Tax=Nostoc sp. TaxID=1180 RepID=UPI002FF6FA8E
MLAFYLLVKSRLPHVQGAMLEKVTPYATSPKKVTILVHGIQKSITKGYVNYA